MLDALARRVAAARKRVLLAALLTMAVAALYRCAGLPIRCPAEGSPDPGRRFHEGNAAVDRASFTSPAPQLIVLVRAPDAIDTPPARTAVDQLVSQLRATDHVTTVTSPWDAPDPVAAGGR